MELIRETIFPIWKAKQNDSNRVTVGAEVLGHLVLGTCVHVFSSFF